MCIDRKGLLGFLIKPEFKIPPYQRGIKGDVMLSGIFSGKNLNLLGELPISDSVEETNINYREL